MNQTIKWMEPWWNLAESEQVKVGIQKELGCEIGPPHSLWGFKPVVIGKSDASDDVVVKLSDGRFACVHLTWSGKTDQQPSKYPVSMIFESVESLQAYMNDIAESYT